MAAPPEIKSPLLGDSAPPEQPLSKSRRRIWFIAAGAALIFLGQILAIVFDSRGGNEGFKLRSSGGSEIVESEVGVVAADDWRCSKIGVSVLRAGGHAVDAAVAAALCLGVVHPMSSGIGGGGFMVVWPAGASAGDSFDFRETAPIAASENMYDSSPSSKKNGALSMGIPGELAGLHAAWLKHGKIPWKSLLQPSIDLARHGFPVEPYLAKSFEDYGKDIIADPGLRQVFAPDGRLLQLNDTCSNHKLADALEVIAAEGPRAFYNGSIGENFIRDLRRVGGIATMEDLRGYRVQIKEAMAADVMGYRLLGMSPPSSGTVGLSMVLNILGGYKSLGDSGSLLGLHRLVEAFKHMFAVRMNLGDPDFVDVDDYVSAMLSPSFADKIRQKIFDNTTFDPSYYLPKWSQLSDHGTSHLCVVDAERNAVSLTSSINTYFGAGLLSPSTGIVVNNEMDDFSIPGDVSSDHLPPAPANFIRPKKRPLSSMAPFIILKENQLAGVIGGSGGMHIIPAVVQVFLNHFVHGLEPLEAVQKPRVYHKLIPNVVLYENWTAIDGERIQVSREAMYFLKQRGHLLKSVSAASVAQLVVHNLRDPVPNVPKRKNGVFYGKLTAVSDPRKDGQPAAKREELRKDELKKEKEYFVQLLNNKMEELSIKTAEFVKLQEKSFALAKELASLKLATDLNLEEPDMVRLASISHGNNAENAVEVLTKSLARRNKSYKELMVQCNNIGRSETRACKKLDLANEKIDKLKIRLKEVEKVLEDKENEVLRDIKASSKLKPKQDNLSHIEQNVSRPAIEDQAMRLYAMKNLNHIANNNCFGQFCKAESNKLQEKSSPSVFKESNHAADFTADSFNHLNVDCLKLISESDGHPSPVVECENGQADRDALLMSGIRFSSIQNAESYVHTKVIAGVAYCESGNDSKDVKESAPAYIKRKVPHTMNIKAAEKILTDDAQNEVPYLTAMQETQVFQSPAFLGANSSRGRWCRQIQQSSSGSGDLIAVGADGRGGRIKVLKSQEQFLGGSKRPKHGAKPRSQFNMEHFFVKQTR